MILSSNRLLSFGSCFWESGFRWFKGRGNQMQDSLIRGPNGSTELEVETATRPFGDRKR